MGGGGARYGGRVFSLALKLNGMVKLKCLQGLKTFMSIGSN